MGHNICVCLICSWKGCFECKGCQKHTKDRHYNESIYFSFNEGGFYCESKRLTVQMRSFYVNEVGESWNPKESEDNYYFDI